MGTQRVLCNEYQQQGLDGSQKSLSSCALDEMRLSIGRVKDQLKNEYIDNWITFPWLV